MVVKRHPVLPKQTTDYYCVAIEEVQTTKHGHFHVTLDRFAPARSNKNNEINNDHYS